MKKTTFFAACRAAVGVEFKKMDGYNEFFVASDGTPLELIFHRSINYGRNTWAISERSTGLSCNEHAPTRKELLNKCTPAFIDRCAAALKKDACIKMRKNLVDYILKAGV